MENTNTRYNETHWMLNKLISLRSYVRMLESRIARLELSGEFDRAHDMESELWDAEDDVRRMEEELSSRIGGVPEVVYGSAMLESALSGRVERIGTEEVFDSEEFVRVRYLGSEGWEENLSKVCYLEPGLHEEYWSERLETWVRVGH